VLLGALRDIWSYGLRAYSDLVRKIWDKYSLTFVGRIKVRGMQALK